MFSEELKNATKRAHQSLEKIIIQHIRAIQTPADYRKLLQFFYSYYHPLEQLLESFFKDTEIIPQFAERRKSVAILHDIQQLGGGPSGTEQARIELPVINTTAAALGAQYVLEGSTLGGVYIAKMLSQQASIPESQLTFFNGYAGTSASMWDTFLYALNTWVKNNGNQREVTEAAIATFEKFERWSGGFYGVTTDDMQPSSLV